MDEQQKGPIFLSSFYAIIGINMFRSEVPTTVNQENFSVPKINLLPVLLLVILFLSSRAPLLAEADPPFTLPSEKELERIRSAIIFTNKGNLYLRLFPKDAPWHVANFKYLADKGFYRNIRFHIHEPGYIIQGGAPGAKANSGPGYTIPPEFNQHRHLTGVLSMVRKPNDLDVEHTRRSHGSQFRILLQNAPQMDGQFTIFGKVIKGIKIARTLKKGDLIKNIIVFVQDDGKRPPQTERERQLQEVEKKRLQDTAQ